jgi:hypothetical protein
MEIKQETYDKIVRAYKLNRAAEKHEDGPYSDEHTRTWSAGAASAFRDVIIWLGCEPAHQERAGTMDKSELIYKTIISRFVDWHGAGGLAPRGWTEVARAAKQASSDADSFADAWGAFRCLVALRLGFDGIPD